MAEAKGAGLREPNQKGPSLVRGLSQVSGLSQWTESSRKGGQNKAIQAGGAIKAEQNG